ncbi:MerR family transcriptional regulator [Halobacillus kuroshimensis]|uniref:MerR family transcriptional regulator n=1 Tax=Halobacillus kuroshimensis TaxID=302481 RepID=UPI0003FA0E54|nr:MerR family transcriptional regulator [Halobacillus kuroshimensis]
MNKQRLSTGEIAKLCQINKKTLFYYDQIDLLKPAVIESNGYRYYTADQIDLLSKIKALQSVGFTLLEIKKQLSAHDISSGIATLHQQKGKIREKINELVRTENHLYQKIMELEHYDTTGNHRVFLQDYDEEYLYLDQTTSTEGSMTNFLLDGYHFGMILNVSSSSEEIEMRKYQKVDHCTKGNDRKEKGTYAGVYFTAQDHNILSNAVKAMSMLHNHGHQLCGPFFLQDVAADFVKFENGQLPFLMTIKVEEV